MGEEITFILSVYIVKSAPQAAESSQSKASFRQEVGLFFGLYKN
jgi:hypothetical protein